MATILIAEARFYPHLNDLLLGGARRVIEAADEQIATLATDGPTLEECLRAAARFTASLYRDSDNLGSRTRNLGALELLHGRAELLAELPQLISGLTPADIAAAAGQLPPDARAILRINPATGGAR